jgi:hypothetical protein
LARGFSIVSAQSRWDYGTAYCIGEIRNNNAVAVGAEIECVARDSAGVLVDTVSFWPALAENIPPGSTKGFRYPVTKDTRMATIEVQVRRTQVWR